VQGLELHSLAGGGCQARLGLLVVAELQQLVRHVAVGLLLGEYLCVDRRGVWVGNAAVALVQVAVQFPVLARVALVG
jgi:hypothetical protein